MKNKSLDNICRVWNYCDNRMFRASLRYRKYQSKENWKAKKRWQELGEKAEKLFQEQRKLMR